MKKYLLIGIIHIIVTPHYILYQDHEVCFSLLFEKISFAMVHLYDVVSLEWIRSNTHDKILEPFPSWFLFNVENMK